MITLHQQIKGRILYHVVLKLLIKNIKFYINMLKNFHLSLLNKFQKQFNLSNYSILWISYAEGILLGLILGYFIF